MANPKEKVPENVPGRFWVDETCIDCDACREMAPRNFVRNEDEGYSYVSKQPENTEEEEQCKDALEGCPVEAIGEDKEAD